MPGRADEGFGNAELSIPHPPSASILTLPKERVIFFDIRFCDFAFGFAQNDKGGFSGNRDYYLLKVKYSF